MPLRKQEIDIMTVFYKILWCVFKMVVVDSEEIREREIYTVTKTLELDKFGQRRNVEQCFESTFEFAVVTLSNNMAATQTEHLPLLMHELLFYR